MEAKQPGNTANDPPLLFLVGGQEFRAHDPRHIRLDDLRKVRDCCLRALDFVQARHPAHRGINDYLGSVTCSIERFNELEPEFIAARDRYLAQAKILCLNEQQVDRIDQILALAGKLSPTTINDYECSIDYFTKVAARIHALTDHTETGL